MADKFGTGFGVGKDITDMTPAESDHLGAKIQPRFSTWQGIKQSAQNFTSWNWIEGQLDAMDSRLGTSLDGPEYNDMTPITAEEAAERFGITGLDRDMTVGEARTIRDYQKNQDYARTIVQNVDPYSLMGPTSAAMIGSMADPVAIAAGMLGGWLIKGVTSGILANGLLKSQRAIRMAKTLASPTIAGVLTRGPLEGLIESAITVPVVAQAHDTLGYSYTYGDAMLEVAGNIIGSTIGDGLSTGVGRLISRNMPEAFASHVNTAAQFELEGRVFSQRLLEMAQHQDVHRPRQGSARVPYSYIAAGDVRGGTFYASMKTGAKELSTAKNNVIDVSFGRGLILTDNPNLAVNAAARAIEMTKGQAFEVKVGDLNLLDLGTPMPDTVRDGMKLILTEKFGKNFADQVLEMPTAKQMLKAIDTESNARMDFDAQESVNELMRAQGFDGYKFVGGDDPMGGLNPEMRHNSLFLFEPKNLEIRSRTEAKVDGSDDVNFRESSSDLSEITREFNSKESLLGYDPEAEAEVEAIGTFKETEAPQEIFSDLDDVLEEMDYVIAETGTKEFDKLKKTLVESSPETYREIAKAADFCVRNS